MPMPILATKLYILPARPGVVLRPRLIGQLNDGLDRRLTLISAPAGSGKTTLLSEWIAGCGRRAAWLSLDEADNEPARFLAYLIAALQTIAPGLGETLAAGLQSPQPPPTEFILTGLLNEIAAIGEAFVLVLDDYHLVDTQAIDGAMAFLLEHLPASAHLAIATREDPSLPLARLRGRGQLTELRAADLRFTPDEAADFLTRAMGLSLSAEDIAALEKRTEGWIAGLQLAAISMQGDADAGRFIETFTGGHHFVMDYLLEEVLHRQPEHIQTFLLRTSVLDRLCGPLCEAVLGDGGAAGQATLELLERANLFLFPLDNERRWYRYHHLFADLLRQRLGQSAGDAGEVDALHVRASQWFEDNGLMIEAFQHAAAANDIDRAGRMVETDMIPLHYPGATRSVLSWLESLPREVRDARPALWVRCATTRLVIGLTTGVEENLEAAETALQNFEETPTIRNLRGQMFSARSTLAMTRYQVDEMIANARLALEYLAPTTLNYRATANWALASGYFFLGDRAAAGRTYAEAIALSREAHNIFTLILATIGLGQVQEADAQYHQARETFESVVEMAGAQPLQIVYEAHLGLAHIFYEWDDLDAAERHAERSVALAAQYDTVIDRSVVCELFLARVKIGRGDVEAAEAIIDRVDAFVQRKQFVFRAADVAEAKALALLGRGDIAGAAQAVEAHPLPVFKARVQLAQGDAPAALTVMESLRSLRSEAEEKGWHVERIRVMALLAVALQTAGERRRAVETLEEALALAEPEGFIRTFVDEGPAMARLLADASTQGIRPGYAGRLLAAFEPAGRGASDPSALPEPLSEREVEVLRLIAEGLSNNEIGERLFLALDTVKGHNRRIFDKLQVQRRTEAVARARELGLL